MNKHLDHCFARSVLFLVPLSPSRLAGMFSRHFQTVDRLKLTVFARMVYTFRLYITYGQVAVKIILLDSQSLPKWYTPLSLIIYMTAPVSK